MYFRVVNLPDIGVERYAVKADASVRVLHHGDDSLADVSRSFHGYKSVICGIGISV